MTALLALIPFGLALWRPKYALALIAAALPAYQVRFVVAGIPTTLLELGLFATALGVLIHLVRGRVFRQRVAEGWTALKSLRWPLVALLASGALATLTAIDHRAALGAFKAWYFDAVLFSFLVVVYRKEVFGPLVAGLAVGTSAISLGGLWEYLFRHAALEDGRLNGVFGTPNYHALLTVPVIVLLAGVALPYPRWRAWLLAALAVNLGALTFTFSYGGYLSLAVGVLMIGAVSGPRVRRTTVAIVLLAGLLFLATQVSVDKFRRLNDLSTRSSTATRLQIWRTSWLLIREHPVTGVGLNAFEPAYRQAIPRIVFPPFEWLVALPHSFPLAVASQTGLVGVAAFVWLLVAFFRAARQRHDWLGATLTAAMVALLVHGLVDTPFFKNDLALLFLLLVVLSPSIRAAGGTSPTSP